jgi:hypothetical protein
MLGHSVERVQENELKTGDLLAIISDKSPDFVLWTRTWGGYVTLCDIKEIRKLGIVTVSYHLDLYMGISREQDIPKDPFWFTDYVFTPDGDPVSQLKFERLGINHIYMPAGVYAPEAKDGAFRPEYAADVAFFGNSYDYHPEWLYRGELVDWLKKTYGDRFKLFGGKTGVRGQDLNDALASIKVVIGDSLVPNYTHQNYWSDRLYELTGRGGFMIFPKIQGLERELDLDTELVTYQFGDFETLRKLIDYFIAHNDEREQFRLAGANRARHNHTYKQRMIKMLETIE